MTEKTKPVLRCAVYTRYTRKSTADGLEQEYNSIDTQRDAGHAYIANRRDEGWVTVDDDYDDTAYPSGNMEWPAQQRLLRDIEHGKIDIVVIYKMDRLTRSLTDFTKMVNVFDKHQVSLVSVTEQTSSANIMSELKLNMLLAFAQFEEVLTDDE